MAPRDIDDSEPNRTGEQKGNVSAVDRRRVLKTIGISAAGFGVSSSTVSAQRSETDHTLVEGKERRKLIEEAYDDLRSSKLRDTIVEAGYGVSRAAGLARRFSREDGTTASVLLPLTLSRDGQTLTDSGKPLVTADSEDHAYFVWQKDGENYAIRIAAVDKLAPGMEIEPNQEFSMSDSGTEIIKTDEHLVSVLSAKKSKIREVTVSLPSNDVTVTVKDAGKGRNGDTVEPSDFCSPSLSQLLIQVGGCAGGCAGCGSLAVGNFTWVAVAGCIVCGGCGCALACCLGQAASDNGCLSITSLYISDPTNFAYACMYSGCSGDSC